MTVVSVGQIGNPASVCLLLQPFDSQTGRIIFRHLAILQTRDLFQIIVDFAVLLFSDPGTTRQDAVV